MNLRQAVKEVIRQNRDDAGYSPSRFIEMTKGGETKEINDSELMGVITQLVTDPEVLKKVLEALEKHHGMPIFIEEFIAIYYFGFPQAVVREAIQRTKEIQGSRLYYIFK